MNPTAMTLATLSDIPAEMDAMAPDLAAREADALCLETLASFWNAGPQNRQRALAFATADGKRFTEEHAK